MDSKDERSGRSIDPGLRRKISISDDGAPDSVYVDGDLTGKGDLAAKWSSLTKMNEACRQPTLRLVGLWTVGFGLVERRCAERLAGDDCSRHWGAWRTRPRNCSSCRAGVVMVWGAFSRCSGFGKRLHKPGATQCHH